MYILFSDNSLILLIKIGLICAIYTLTETSTTQILSKAGMNIVRHSIKFPREQLTIFFNTIVTGWRILYCAINPLVALKVGKRHYDRTQLPALYQVPHF